MHAVDAPLRPLISAQEIETRIAELAKEIERDYEGVERLICLGVLKGSVFFLVDLVRRLSIPVVLDFFQTSAYGDSTDPGEVRIRKDIEVSIRGRHVLLVEDVVDTGYTLRTILDLLHFRGAASVKLCTLLNKEPARRIEVPIDYCGFEIGDRFVVGYGLDVGERYRNLPYIAEYVGGEPETEPSPSEPSEERSAP